MNYSQYKSRLLLLLAALLILIVASTRMRADSGSCGGATISLPFTDVQGNIFFCAIAEAYISGLTAGTSATTYSPTQNVPREQMAAFITRTMDQSLKRGSRRAALQQFWQPTVPIALTPTSAGDSPTRIACDGTDLWATTENAVIQIQASSGRYLGVYLDAENPHDVIAAAGYVFATGLMGPSTPGRVYYFSPQIEPPASVVILANTGPNPTGITFDGANLWTANNAGGLIGGSISRIPFGDNVTTFTAGFTAPADILWDGENLWVADFAADRVRRVDPTTGVVLQSILVGDAPRELLFDGQNLWVSNFFGGSVTVIRATGGLRGTVLATLTGNGLTAPAGLAFDGERVLVCNFSPGAASSVSLFKAADLTPLGNLSTDPDTKPLAACSDGLNFFITRSGHFDIVRF
jgi:hypothetical protein